MNEPNPATEPGRTLTPEQQALVDEFSRSLASDDTAKQNGAAPTDQPGVTLTAEEMKILGLLRKAKDDPTLAGSDTILRLVDGWIETNEMTPEDWAAAFAPPPPIGDLDETEEEVIRQFRYRKHVTGPWYRPKTNARVAKRDLGDPMHRRAWMLFGQLIEAGFIEMPNLDVEGGHLGMFDLVDRAEQIHSDVMGLVWILDHLDASE